MSTDRETTRVVRSWLEEGVTALPDRVLDAVLDQVPATPQWRSMWPPRRFSTLNKYLALGSAAALVVGALVALQVLRPQVFGPASTPTFAPTPVATVVPTAFRQELRRSVPLFLTPGDFALDHVLGRPMTVTIPAEWTGLEHGPGNALLVKTVVDAATGKRGAFGTVGNSVLLGFYEVDRVFADPCKDVSGATPAPTDIAAYVDALSQASGITAGTAIDVSIGGLPAKQLDLVNDIDPRHASSIRSISGAMSGRSERAGATERRHRAISASGCWTSTASAARQLPGWRRGRVPRRGRHRVERDRFEPAIQQSAGRRIETPARASLRRRLDVQFKTWPGLLLCGRLLGCRLRGVVAFLAAGFVATTFVAGRARLSRPARVARFARPRRGRSCSARRGPFLRPSGRPWPCRPCRRRCAASRPSGPRPCRRSWPCPWRRSSCRRAGR